MHDPAMMELTQITTLISIVFLLWSAHIWIFGIKHAREPLPAGCSHLCRDPRCPLRTVYDLQSWSNVNENHSVPYHLFCLLLLFSIMPGIASAYATPESIVAAGKVYVSNIAYDPESFFTGDTGTVTVYVTNGNSNQSIVVNHATIGDKNIRLTSNPYDTSANIGPLQTQTFIFSVATDAFEGTYYPTFSLSFRDADSLYYRAMVKVDNTPLEMTVVDKPDAFTQGKKKTIYVQVANPRNNKVTNVALEVTGEGAHFAPSNGYSSGILDAGEKIPVNFSRSPRKKRPQHC